ncbi:uncharacterized protein LOC115232424 [Octopus sinensis]|uniref:Uncharacterized protein LOC115232424 n=1 Tax=Octopus sinensis TaxID=2607531 RepID=A0A6P7U2G4_9MOLL|nr:uncharacterized protein LOC115232424 [Octopus sinensis]
MSKMGKCEKLEDLYERFWQWRLDDSPDFAAFCGKMEYNDRVDDLSVDAYKKQKPIIEGFLKEASAIDMSDLDHDSKINLRLLKEDLESTLKGLDFMGYYFPISFLENPHINFMFRIDWMQFKEEADYKKYVACMKSFVKQLGDIEAILLEGIEKKMICPIESVKEVPQQLEDLIKKIDSGTSVFLNPFKKTPTNEKLLGMVEETKTELSDILQNQLKPALQKLKEFLENVYLKHSRQEPGACYLPNGKEFYDACVRFHTSSNLSPEEIHKLGLSEVERIKSEIMKIYKAENLPLDMKECSQILKTRKEFFCQTKEELLEYVKKICEDEIMPLIPKYFKDLPDIEMIIKPTPEGMDSSPAAFYLAGTPDGSRMGTYMINTSKFDVSPKYEIPALCLHEGIPGHHTQASAALKIENCPAFRCFMQDMKYYLAPSRFLLHTAYMEGWGLYCEALGKEMGLYTDNYKLLGRYNFEMHRACRLVVDTGIHAMRWSRQKAIDYMNENCPIDSLSISNEVDRYITWPGQALGYKIGELKIWEFRRKAEKALGSKFDIRDFHDVVLKAGCVSLCILEELVDDYIKETLQ